MKSIFMDLLKVDTLTISAIVITETDVEFIFKMIVLISTLAYNVYKIKNLKNKK